MSVFKRHYLAMLLLLVQGWGHANEPKVEPEFREYRVHLYDDFVAPVKLPVGAVESLRHDIKQFALSIRECQTSSGQWQNPMLGRTTTYKITMGQAGCVLELDSLGTWLYICRLSEPDRTELATAIDSRVVTDGVLGDYSPAEKSILFDPDLCETKRL